MIYVVGLDGYLTADEGAIPVASEETVMSNPGGRVAQLGRTILRSAPSEIPPGSALVHNDVKPDSPTFAIWLQWWPRPRDGLERCECGWRWDLGDHYRYRVRP